MKSIPEDNDEAEVVDSDNNGRSPAKKKIHPLR